MESTRDEVMENIAAYQLKTVLRLILELIKGCELLEEAQTKIEALLSAE